MPTRKLPITIRDEIHGDIVFDHILSFVLDHKYFQRLRYIRQLGLAEYVFPCATHNRFQHSLGTAFLASEYYQSFLKTWLNSRFQFEKNYRTTEFFPEETFNLVTSVALHEPSREFWYHVTTLAGLLHDIGHGPWSHAFEVLRLEEDFSEVTSRIRGAIRKYFESVVSDAHPWQHEDISTAYVFRILEDLENTGLVEGAMKFFVPVATLVNRKLMQGAFKAQLERELDEVCRSRNLEGGAKFHRLLGPLISGPFDVDRIDYIQRDGRNCGVPMGGIEWRRIVGKLVPCLANHPNERNQPTDVVLISSIQNQHVLDDFIFSLFQMYTQIYLHPKIVALEENIRNVLRDKMTKKRLGVLTLEKHSQLTDERFREVLVKELGAPEIDDLLLRKRGSTFRVTTSPADQRIERELTAHSYRQVQTLDRPMMKDSVGVFLYSAFKDPSKPGSDEQLRLITWEEASPISKEFYSVNYSPKIWVLPE